MSLFKLDSKIYGAWTVDREVELLKSDYKSQLSNSSCPKYAGGDNEHEGNSKTDCYTKDS